MNTRAQMWYLDVIISLLIFSLAITLFFHYGELPAQTQEELLEEMGTDANAISAFLLSTGAPANWTNETVVIPGLISEAFNVSWSKWAVLGQIYNDTPNRVKSLYGTKFNTFVELIHLNNSIIESIGQRPENETTVVQTTRLVLDGSTIRRMRISVWTI